MSHPFGDENPDDWPAPLHTPRWWRRPPATNHQESLLSEEGDDNIGTSFVLTIEVIANMLRVVSVAPPEQVADALRNLPNGMFTEDDQDRLIVWCSQLVNELLDDE